MTIFLNPRDSSYMRLGNSAAPDRVNWSGIRETGLVYIETRKGRTRAELRSPDAEGNPYLVYALLIRAGLAGIRERMPLPEERSDTAELLPSSRKEAGKLAAGSDFIRACLPEEIIAEYTGR